MLNCEFEWRQLAGSICPGSASLSQLSGADYRWFPTGKIVFLAPTKPLVHQQIEACQMTCGIPSADAAVMTGANVSAKDRAKLVSELGGELPSTGMKTNTRFISGRNDASSTAHLRH